MNFNSFKIRVIIIKKKQTLKTETWISRAAQNTKIINTEVNNSCARNASFCLQRTYSPLYAHDPLLFARAGANCFPRIYIYHSPVGLTSSILDSRLSPCSSCCRFGVLLPKSLLRLSFVANCERVFSWLLKSEPRRTSRLLPVGVMLGQSLLRRNMPSGVRARSSEGECRGEMPSTSELRRPPIIRTRTDIYIRVRACVR